MKAFHLLLCLLIGGTAIAASPTGRYKDVVDKMNQLQTQFPQFASVYSIGQNDDGVDIYAMRISLTPTKMDPTKAGYLVVGTHHGNELYAATFSVEFLQSVLARYTSHELFHSNLPDIEWTFVPVLNISGYNANNRYEDGQDPNRDYPGPCISAQGGKLKSIKLMMNLLESRVFAGSLTVHGYLGGLTYPWGVDVDKTATKDQNFYDSVFSKAAKLNGYRYGTSTDVVYPCDGTFEDYVYWKKGIFSMLLELVDGSTQDRADTVKSTTLFFDSLDSSPSVNNQFTTSCRSMHDRRPDPHLE